MLAGKIIASRLNNLNMLPTMPRKLAWWNHLNCTTSAKNIWYYCYAATTMFGVRAGYVKGVHNCLFDTSRAR